MHWPKLTRDGILFIGGIAGIVYETVFHDGQSRPALVAVFAGMMGLPAFLRTDEKIRKNGNGGDDDNGK